MENRSVTITSEQAGRTLKVLEDIKGKTVSQIKSEIPVANPEASAENSGEQLSLDLDWILSESVSSKKTFQGHLFDYKKLKFEKLEANIFTGDHDPYLTFKGKITAKDITRVEHFLKQLQEME